MGRALLDGTAVPFAADFGAYHWDPLNALRTTFDTADGRLVHAIPSGLFYLGQPVAPYWFGPLGLLGIVGAAWVVRRAGLVASVLLVGWPVVVLVFLAGSPYQNTRFFLSVLPPVAIAIALGLWRLALRRWIPGIPADRRRRRPSPWARSSPSIWIVGAVVVAGRFTDAFIARQTADLAAIRSLEAQVPPGARLISMGADRRLRPRRGPGRRRAVRPGPGAAARPPRRRPAELPRHRRRGDRRPMGGSRRRRSTVEAIRASRGLTRIDEAGVWTLYRIGSP